MQQLKLIMRPRVLNLHTHTLMAHTHTHTHAYITHKSAQVVVYGEQIVGKDKTGSVKQGKRKI